MNRHDQLLTVIQHLREAITIATYAKRLAPLERTVQKGASTFFRKQGLAVGRKLASRWSLSEADSTDFLDKTLDDTPIDFVTDALKNSFVKGMAATGQEYKLGLSFDLKNPRAVEYIDKRALSLLKELNTTTKEDIRTIISDGLDAGDSYNTIARTIRSKFADYSTNRAKRVAVTETGMAYQAGNYGAMLDATGTGLTFEKSWLAEQTACPICQGNADQDWITLDTNFSSGDLHPIAHPMCRCATLYRRLEGAAAVVVPEPQPEPLVTKDASSGDVQQSVKDALTDLYDRKSIWSGVVNFVKNNSAGIFDPNDGSIEINKDVHAQYPDRSFKTLVHELTHSFSGAIRDKSLSGGMGWEEAVVEKLAQVHVVSIAKQAGYIFKDVQGLQDSFATHPYQRYMQPLENARKKAKIDEAEFYNKLLPMNITQRRTYLSKVLKAELGNKDGTAAYIAVDRALST